jgi:hypothetical protein
VHEVTLYSLWLKIPQAVWIPYVNTIKFFYKIVDKLRDNRLDIVE